MDDHPILFALILFCGSLQILLGLIVVSIFRGFGLALKALVLLALFCIRKAIIKSREVSPIQSTEPAADFGE